MQTFKAKAYGASGSLIGGKTLKPMDIDRRNPEKDELLIEILYCGVCHSDIHQVNDDWDNTLYPCVPGHEIIGRVVSKGAEVTNHQTGDIVGVGCMIDSCRHCHQCHDGEEQFCQGPYGATMTYNGYLKPNETGFNTFGGYSTHIVVKERFVLRIPQSLDVKAAAPILCAGITTYSPLKRAGIKQGSKVGVAGIGGLGHMAVMIAKAMGAEVTAITTSDDKKADALSLGADKVLLSEDEDDMEAAEMTLDFILITIPDAFDVNPYVKLLKVHGSLVTVGLLGPYSEPLDNNEVAMKGRSVGGSLIGGIKETQEILNFCASNGIQPQIELINIEDINDAYDRIMKEDVRFRYVIDMQSLKSETKD